MPVLRPIVLSLLLAAATASGAQPRFVFAETPGRLSKQVRPLLQQLTLEIDPAADHFAGRSTIALQLEQGQPELRLHAHRLQARASDWIDANGRKRQLTVHADESTQTWRLVPVGGQPLPRGQGRLQLRWRGQVQESANGLYRAPYGPPGSGHAILATQLEAVFARRVFPTFDEPAFRTPFDVSVRTPGGWQVLSNMPGLVRSEPDGRQLHRFQRTPPMPSYLVALSVGRFEWLQGRAAGVPLRIVTTPGKRAQGAYALRATEQLLPYYTHYFSQRYALPKLDQLAVPSTRDGAMEDWGLISYSEDDLLFDPTRSNASNQRVIFDLVAHEIAHQWFGNLVTAASWDEIWLNEAFATWMAEKASAHFNPRWQLPLRRRAGLDRTMDRDAGSATHAIRAGTVLEDRVFDAFDDITYTKGGAVLAMLEAWVGEETMRLGLAAYLRERRLSNATAGDLWFHIGKAAGRDVAAVASTWTDQPGLPLVRVDSRCEGGWTRLRLHQQPLRDASDGGTADAAAGRRWQVPLTLWHDGRARALLLEQASEELYLPGCPTVPTLVNASGIGFYRVAYDDATDAALAQAFAQLPGTGQVSLLSDRFALAQAGLAPMRDWLALLAHLPTVRGNARPALWSQARSGLELLRDALAGSSAEGPLKALRRALMAPELQRLGWLPQPGEDSDAEMLRTSLIGALARDGDPDVLARAGALFDAAEAGGSALPATIRSAVIAAAGRGAGAARHDALRRHLLAATSEQDRSTYATAVAATPDAAQRQAALELALDPRLPANVAIRMPTQIAYWGLHGDLPYRFVKEHGAALAERAGDMFGAKDWLLPAAAWPFNTAAAAERLLADQKALRGEPGSATARQTAARIRRLAALRERGGQALAAQLQALAQRLSGP